MGRPPIGKVAMTSTERVHRFRAKHRKDKPETKRNETEAELRPRIRMLEAELADLKRHGQLTRSRRASQTGVGGADLSEAGILRRKIVGLKSDITKLKLALQEEPDAAKLRKKVVDQQVEMRGLRAVLKQTAKERDEYQARVKAYALTKHIEARQKLTRQNYNILIKTLHSDRTKQVSADELKEAERLVVALRPLFEER
jgi:hypothetical protein